MSFRHYRGYRVIWEINLSARTPREAAQRALEIQRDPDSSATVFDVLSATKMTRIDVAEKPTRKRRKK